MNTEQKELFDRQYGEKSLVYEKKQIFLRKLLRRWLNTRYNVTMDMIALLPKGKAILDFGCGKGNYLFDIHEKYEGLFEESHGIDICSKNIEYAKKKTSSLPDRSNFFFYEGDETILSQYNDEFFDCIIAIAIFYAIYDIYKVASNLRRILKKGCSFILEVPNLAYYRNRMKLLMGKLPTTTPTSIDVWPTVGWDSSTLHYFTRKTIIRFLIQCGFYVEKIKPTGLIVNMFKMYPSLLATGFVIKAIKK